MLSISRLFMCGLAERMKDSFTVVKWISHYISQTLASILCIYIGSYDFLVLIWEIPCCWNSTAVGKPYLQAKKFLHIDPDIAAQFLCGQTSALLIAHFHILFSFSYSTASSSPPSRFDPRKRVYCILATQMHVSIISAITNTS